MPDLEATLASWPTPSPGLGALIFGAVGYGLIALGCWIGPRRSKR